MKQKTNIHQRKNKKKITFKNILKIGKPLA